MEEVLLLLILDPLVIKDIIQILQTLQDELPCVVMVSELDWKHEMMEILSEVMVDHQTDQKLRTDIVDTEANLDKLIYV